MTRWIDQPDHVRWLQEQLARQLAYAEHFPTPTAARGTSARTGARTGAGPSTRGSRPGCCTSTRWGTWPESPAAPRGPRRRSPGSRARCVTPSTAAGYATVWPGRPDLYHSVHAVLLQSLPLAPSAPTALARGLCVR